MAGILGFEPRHVGVKVRCVNQLRQMPIYGGEHGVRSHKPFQVTGFQDQRDYSISANSPFVFIFMFVLK